MRKLNKIIKQHTNNKMARKKKNIEVMEYLDYMISISKRTEMDKIRNHYFNKLREVVFLEKYFEKEMIEKKVDIVEILHDYFDLDLFDVNEQKIEEVYKYLTYPDEESRNRVKLVCVSLKYINAIMNEYKGY